MHGSSVVIASRVGVSVAVEIRQESALVVQGMLQGTRTLVQLMREVLQEPIQPYPVIAHPLYPPRPELTFPLRSKIPAQGYRSAPYQRRDGDFSVFNWNGVREVDLKNAKLDVR